MLGPCTRTYHGKSKISAQQEQVITINEPVDYMAHAVMILMREKDITRVIGKVGLKVKPVLGQTFNTTLTMAQVMSLPHIKIITAKHHIKKQVHWYFYANENR